MAQLVLIRAGFFFCAKLFQGYFRAQCTSRPETVDRTHFRPVEFVSRLKCHLGHGLRRRDPYFFLGPAKVEVAHADPDILVFHEVISEDERKELMEVAEPEVWKK